MAFQMSYTDQYGDEYAQSYWKIDQINNAKHEGWADLIFCGYANEASKGKRVIGIVSIRMEGDDYTNSMTALALSPEGNNPEKAGYVYAKTQAFFDGAIDV